MLRTNHLLRHGRTGWRGTCVGLMMVATMVGCGASDDEFSIAGSELVMRVDGVPMTSGTDTEFAAGGIALLADRSVVSWDDIVVTIP